MPAPATCLVTLTANAALAKTLAQIKPCKLLRAGMPSFLEGAAYDNRMNAKEKYRKLKTEGKI